MDTVRAASAPIFDRHRRGINTTSGLGVVSCFLYTIRRRKLQRQPNFWNEKEKYSTAREHEARGQTRDACTSLRANTCSRRLCCLAHETLSQLADTSTRNIQSDIFGSGLWTQGVVKATYKRVVMESSLGCFSIGWIASNDFLARPHAVEFSNIHS
jgi:hypothetical protein